MAFKRKKIRRKNRPANPTAPAPEQVPVDPDAPDWTTPCASCGAKPTVRGMDLCGPCCFGEARTAGGNW